MRSALARPRTLAALAALSSLACVGAIGAGPDAPGGRGGPSEPKPGPPAPAGAPGPTCGAAAPWRTMLLTRQQYVNTLSDLLGFDVTPQVKFADTGGRKFSAGVTVTPLQAEERLRSAEAIAATAASPANLPRVLGCDPNAASDACTDRFLDRFGGGALRRALDDDMRTGLRQLFQEGRAAGGVAGGVEWVVGAVLQSVEFLYHVAPVPSAAKPGSVVPLDPLVLAERLSYFLWDSAPDDALTSAATGGHLRGPGDVEAQVRRMLADPKAARTRSGFYRSWLELDNLASLTRDDPAFTPALARALEDSVLAGIEDVYGNGARSDALLGASTVFVDGAMASLYAPARVGQGAALAPVVFDRTERRGLLTHPALLTVFADADASDPIRRGKFVATRLFCQELPPPADDIPPLPPLRAGLSTRQRLQQHRMSPACSGCHRLFDPVGLAFESYDFLGRLRTQDHGVPVDTSGEVVEGLDGLSGPFANGMELVDRIAGSGLVRGCLAAQWYAYAVGGDAVPTEACAVDAVKARFAKNGDLADLLVAIATAESFRNRLVEE